MRPGGSNVAALVDSDMQQEQQAAMAAVLAAEFRGFRLNFDGGYALVYSLAGRTQITIETSDGSAQVSVLTADNSKDSVMGIQSVLATEDQALGLLIASRKAFVGGAKFQRDDKVGLDW